MQVEINKVEDVQDLVVTVMGLGRFKQGSGVGAAKWLLRHGAQIVVTDLKNKTELKGSVDLIMDWYTESRAAFPDRTIYAPVFKLGAHDPQDFVNVELIVKNPDVPQNSEYLKLAMTHGITVESDVSIFFHLYQKPICAVTGTRGKSTTTTLLGEMLKKMHPKAVTGGNVMHSPLEDLDWLLEEKEAVPVALELSSWLLESLDHIKKGPEIAVITNVSKDHLDRYGSFEAYAKTKESLFQLQDATQKAVANYDHELVRAMGERAPGKTYWFSASPLPTDRDGAFIDEKGDLHLRDATSDRRLCHVSEWPALQGTHNIQNALAASLAASLAGVPDEAICETLKTFAGLDGRQQTVRELHGVTYVNDTCATSPDGVVAALARFGKEAGDKKLVLIVGGKSKGFDEEMKALGEHIKQTCKHVVYLEGSHTNLIEDAVGGAVPDSHAKSMQEAVELASRAAEEGDVVLLSPGGSSFDLFQNEFDRGGQFVEQVKLLL